jgi:hypothetical protein
VAETKSTNVTTRRGFLGTVGVAVAASALPAAGLAATGRAPGTAASHRAAWRADYLQEIEYLAAILRPGFEAGRLHSWRGSQDDCPAVRELERRCGDYFGLPGDVESWEAGTGDETARMILAVSPHAASTGEGAPYPVDHAREAVAWDVVAIARERRWYTPSEDECEDPARQIGVRAG